MELSLNPDIAKAYKSPSQKIRVLTEHWLATNAYCPTCGTSLVKTRNNSRVLDFVCGSCDMTFELKSKRGPLGLKLVDGAYDAMLNAIQHNRQPNFFFLSYDNHFLVHNLALLSRRFIVQDVVEKRRPLSATARRAGWTGCNLLLSNLPKEGMIYYVKNGVVYRKESVFTAWRDSAFLDAVNLASRSWTIAIMNCVERLHMKTFTLHEMYNFVPELQTRFPNNKHIKPKIRQQLQLLRDEGWLTFLEEGVYSLKTRGAQ